MHLFNSLSGAIVAVAFWIARGAGRLRELLQAYETTS